MNNSSNKLFPEIKLTEKDIIAYPVFKLREREDSNTIVFSNMTIWFEKINNDNNQTTVKLSVISKIGKNVYLSHPFRYICSPQNHILEEMVEKAYENKECFLEILDEHTKETFNFKVTEEVRRKITIPLTQCSYNHSVVNKTINNPEFGLLEEQNDYTITFNKISIWYGDEDKEKNQINLRIDVHAGEDENNPQIYIFHYLCSPEIHILEDNLKDSYEKGGLFLSISDKDTITTFNFKVTEKVKKQMLEKLAQYRRIGGIATKPDVQPIIKKYNNWVSSLFDIFIHC